jgi:hypothetical protein
MPEFGPAIFAHGCAMIFGSSRQYVKLLDTSQVAWRSTPMGIDRTNLSCRTILFFFALLVAPKVALSATIEDSARELARKVAAALPAHDRVSIEIRNISSLAADEVLVVEQTLTNELQIQSNRSPLDSANLVNVRVTLSENIKKLSVGRGSESRRCSSGCVTGGAALLGRSDSFQRDANGAPKRKILGRIAAYSGRDFRKGIKWRFLFDFADTRWNTNPQNRQ